MSDPARRAPRAPSLDNLARAIGLPLAAPLARCYRDEHCPCDACVARDVDLVSAVASDRARRAADEAAALAKHGPAKTAEALGFAPVATGPSPACATIEQLRRVLLGRGA